MALLHYDRHVPLFDGLVTADKVSREASAKAGGR
jgi:hypothetical protein